MERGIDNESENSVAGALHQKKSIRIEDLSTANDLDSSSNIDSSQIDQSCEFIGNALETFWKTVGQFFSKRSSMVRSVFYIILATLYNAYFIASVYYSIHNGIPMDWCNGVGFLIVLPALTYLGLFYFQVVNKFWGESIHQSVLKPIGKAFDKVWKYRSVPVLRWNSYQTIFQNDNNWFRLAHYGFYLVLIVGLLTFLIIDTADERMRLQSFGGLFIFLVLGWIFSKYPSRVTCRIFLCKFVVKYLWFLYRWYGDTSSGVWPCSWFSVWLSYDGILVEEHSSVWVANSLFSLITLLPDQNSFTDTWPMMKTLRE